MLDTLIGLAWSLGVVGFMALFSLFMIAADNAAHPKRKDR